MKISSYIRTACMAATVFLAAAAGAKDDFPPAKEVFRYAVESDGRQLTVYWNVLPGYYLYRSRLSLDSATPGIRIGKPKYPKGEIHHDDYFGNQEIYRDDFTVTVPLVRQNSTVVEMKLKLKLQGCADAGLCYPPTVWETKVKLPSKS